MKKILLGTTALISAALASGAMAAELPKVKVGGFADFQLGIMSDDQDAAQRAHGFRNDTEVTFDINATADNGLQYGAKIDLEADVTADSDAQGLNASRTYVYLQGAWGRFELGSNEGAEDTLKVDASSIARATGGIDGDFYYYSNASTGFLAKPDLPLAYGAGFQGNESQNNVNKVTYYSPRFSGFQVGLSYAPDSTDRGQTVTRTDNIAGGAGDIFSAGLNYEGQFSQIGVKAAATGSWGDSDVAATEDLRAWNIGTTISYAGFSVAGSYGDLSDSLQVSSWDSDYWTLGAAYEYGPFGVSITYLNSDYGVNGDNEFENFSIGADYKLAEGLTPYAEISFYDQDAPGVVNDNDGTVFIVGTQLAF